MENLKKALDERLEKAKYLRRTGTRGHYKYIYKEKGPKEKKEQSKKIKSDFYNIFNKNDIADMKGSYAHRSDYEGMTDQQIIEDSVLGSDREELDLTNDEWQKVHEMEKLRGVKGVNAKTIKSDFYNIFNKNDIADMKGSYAHRSDYEGMTDQQIIEDLVLGAKKEDFDLTDDEWQKVRRMEKLRGLK